MATLYDFDSQEANRRTGVETGPPLERVPREYIRCVFRPDRVEVELDPADDGRKNARLLRHALQGGVGDGPTLAGGAGEVLLPQGRFEINGSIPISSGQSLIGVSPVAGSTLRSAGLELISVRGQGVCLQALRIEHPPAGAGIGIDLAECAMVTIQDVHIDGFTTGVLCTAGIRKVTDIHISGCRFTRCGVGIRSTSVASPGMASVELVHITSSAFEVERADVQGAGIQLVGDSVVVTGCRFMSGAPSGVVNWRAVDLAGRATAVRYNVFDAPAPHCISPADRFGLDGAVVEHNVHLHTNLAVATVERGLNRGVHRGAGQGRVDTGEGQFNRLLNGSFEWWEDRRTFQGASPHPVGWIPGPGVRVGAVRNDNMRPGEDPDAQFADPDVRHGRAALLAVVSSPTLTHVRAEPVSVVVDGPLTASCWVRIDRSVQANRPAVRVKLEAGDFEARSQPYVLEPDHPATWQRLACTVLVPRNGVREATFSVEIDCRRCAGTAETRILLDGAAVHAGYFAFEPDAGVVADVGGELLGPTEFRGHGAEVKSHIRLVPEGNGEMFDAIPVPSHLHLVGIRYSSAEVVNLDVVQISDHDPPGVIIASVRAAGRVGEVAVARQPVPAGALLRVEAQNAGAPIDVVLRFRASVMLPGGDRTRP